jgi:hypothetical protein
LPFFAALLTLETLNGGQKPWCFRLIVNHWFQYLSSLFGRGTAVCGVVGDASAELVPCGSVCPAFREFLTHCFFPEKPTPLFFYTIWEKLVQ